MVVYVVAIPLQNSDEEADWQLCSQLWLVGALLFVVESLMDLIWAAKRWLAEAKLALEKVTYGAIPRFTSHDMAVPLAEVEDDEGQPRQCVPWLDRIHWDFHAALWFLIPSVFYTVSSLLDPYVVVWSWLNLLRGAGMSDDDYSVLCSDIAACIYIFDGLIGLIGRYSEVRQTPPDEQLFIVKIWAAKGFFQVDWAAWGDICFFIGAVLGVAQQFLLDIVWLNWVVQLLWLADAMFYMLACFPTMRTMTKNRVIAATSPVASRRPTDASPRPSSE